MTLWTGQGRSWGRSKPNQVETSQREYFDRDPDRDYWAPSQVAIFRDCKRKWAFKYIDKIKSPQNGYALFGSYLHDRLQEYSETGKLPGGQGLALTITKPDGEEVEYAHDDIMAIMLPGIKHLPAPGVAKCEGLFEMDLGELGVMIGYIDLTYDEKGIPVVGDHKTTSGLHWALKKDELREDVQGITYAVAKLESTGADRVILRWVYFLRDPKKAKARKVEVVLGLTDTVKSWENIIEDIKQMQQIKRSVSCAKDVDYNAEACDKYGGCPYKESCGLSVMDRIRSLRTMLSLRDRMKNGTQTPTAEPIPQPATGVGQAVNPPEGMSALERLKAKKAQQASVPASATKPEILQETAVIPEQVEAPKTEVAAEPSAALAVLKAKKAQNGTKPKPAKEVPAEKASVKKETVSLAGTIPTLYVDCAPIQSARDTVQFAELVSPVLQQIEAEAGCHYRLIPDLFGGNAAVFAQALAAHLDTLGPIDVVVDMRTQEARDVYEVLASRAMTIVRGF